MDIAHCKKLDSTYSSNASPHGLKELQELNWTLIATFPAIFPPRDQTPHCRPVQPALWTFSVHHSYCPFLGLTSMSGIHFRRTELQALGNKQD
ncbi:hypothetical protein LEMLEM_LOCUS15924 [Lemmus lemmus]